MSKIYGIGDEEELAEDLQKELFELKRNPNIIEIPEGATNGDMMKTLFKNAIIEERDYGVIIFSISNLPLWYANKDWWNAPYKLSELKGENNV